MRRLVKRSREDSYKSKRDYQSIHTRNSSRLILGMEEGKFYFKPISIESNISRVGFSIFIKPSQATNLTISIVSDGVEHNKVFSLRNSWNRIGFSVEISDEVSSEDMLFSISVNGIDYIDLWGLNLGGIVVPEEIIDKLANEDINKTSMCPETFYMKHDSAIFGDFDSELSSEIHLDSGDDIEAKKCPYCGRFLPMSSSNPGSLSFNRHSAKLTGHQNECRACKKWRINGELNQLRTADQLNESSVITRERKVLLKEPELIQGYKDIVTGEGLKSRVWKRFNKKCCYCDTELELKDVRLDHTRPLAYLWPIDEYATCLCETHNGQKGDRFPVDFYGELKLLRLSEITGLSLDELKSKKVNEVELARIRNNLPELSRKYDAKTFVSINRKVRELRPDIDLFAELDRADPEAFRDLRNRLSDREE